MGNEFAGVPPAVECAWCKALLSPGTVPVSHGICEPCRREQFRQFAEQVFPARILLLIPTAMLVMEIALEGVM